MYVRAQRGMAEDNDIGGSSSFVFVSVVGVRDWVVVAGFAESFVEGYGENVSVVWVGDQCAVQDRFDFQGGAHAANEPSDLHSFV